MATIESLRLMLDIAERLHEPRLSRNDLHTAYREAGLCGVCRTYTRDCVCEGEDTKKGLERVSGDRDGVAVPIRWPHLMPQPTDVALSIIPIQYQSPVATPMIEDEEEDADATGLDEEELQTIMVQAMTTRDKAVKSLRKHRNIVDAILELTP